MRDPPRWFCAHEGEVLLSPIQPLSPEDARRLVQVPERKLSPRSGRAVHAGLESDLINLGSTP